MSCSLWTSTQEFQLSKMWPTENKERSEKLFGIYGWGVTLTSAWFMIHSLSSSSHRCWTRRGGARNSDVRFISWLCKSWFTCSQLPSPHCHRAGSSQPPRWQGTMVTSTPPRAGPLPASCHAASGSATRSLVRVPAKILKNKYLRCRLKWERFDIEANSVYFVSRTWVSFFIYYFIFFFIIPWWSHVVDFWVFAHWSVLRCWGIFRTNLCVVFWGISV